MIVIDGAEGEGGGQVLRNALALSIVTGQPFRIDNIRGRRARPGLMRQHVTAVEAACAVGGADCEGVGIGSACLTFRPGRIRAGDHRFAIGTAGSTGLVLQTILAPLLLADRPSRIVLEGGTHNPNAPPFDFIDRVFLPLVRRMGVEVTATLVRPGFYPAGGGRIEVTIVPAPRLAGLELVRRGALQAVQAVATVAGLPDDIARREIAACRAVLGWPDPACTVVDLPAACGPGNILTLEARFDHATEIVSGFGTFGRPARAVAGQAAARMAGYLASTAFAGPYLADQLLLPMALAGCGRFTTVKPSEHTRTAARIIGLFLDCPIAIAALPDGTHGVDIGDAARG